LEASTYRFQSLLAPLNLKEVDMDRITINTTHPKLEFPRVLADIKKSDDSISATEAKHDEFKFTTESSMENNYDAAYQKLNPRTIKNTRPSPTSENWIG
jgi:diacylglycerol kinase family enzyme